MACEGYNVTLYERRSIAGGKASTLNLRGYRFDTGPSLVTMPWIFRKLFASANSNFDRAVTLKPLDIHCSYRWSDGVVFKAASNKEEFIAGAANATGESPDALRSFLDYCGRIYNVAGDLFLNHSLQDIRTYRSPKFWRSLLQVWRLDPFRSMRTSIESIIRTEKIRQLFSRYATYNGSSPYLAPATFNLIAHVELDGGCYAIQGGIYDIPRAFVSLAEKLGVTIRYNEPAVSIEMGTRANATAHINGEAYDAVISNLDIETTYRLLRDEHAPELRRYRRLATPSSSALVFCWGIRGGSPELSEHNIFFSDNYQEEFDAIFTRRQCPTNPTIYLHNGSLTTPKDAPANCENWFVLINAPIDCGQNWKSIAMKMRAHIIDTLSSHLRFSVERHIEVEHIITPRTIAKESGNANGNLYGIASNSIAAAFGRHPNRSTRYPYLYFCGGSAHPGGGMPLVTLSGTIAADLAARDLQRRRKRRQDRHAI